jgi:hypothetical protein
MSKETINFIEIPLREILSRAGLNSQAIDIAVADYIRYRESSLGSRPILSYKNLQRLNWEKFIELRNEGFVVEDILRKYLWYLDYKKQIAETYLESKSWNKVITTAVTEDSQDSQEAFIDYVEEISQTKVIDAKHLQRLTGITEETLEGLEETITASRYNKYMRALNTGLADGGKYNYLLQINPQNYGLPKTWSGCLGSDQYSSILWAIEEFFLMNERNSSPDLRAIAKEIDAPYSVLIDAHIIFNSRYGTNSY